MADLSANNWNEQDAANDAAAPNGLPAGSLANTLYPVIKDTRGAMKRFWNRVNAFYTTTGNANALAITFAQAPVSYVKGERYAFFPNATNTGAMTLSFNALGPRSIVRYDGTALVAGDVAAGLFTEVFYDGAAFRLTRHITQSPTYTGPVTASGFVGDGSALTALDASKITTGTISDARLPATLSAKTFTGPVTGTTAVLNEGRLVLNSTTGTVGVYLQSSGGNRAINYYNPATNSLVWDLWNAAGAYARHFSFRESDGLLDVNGAITTNGYVSAAEVAATGQIKAGGAVFAGASYLQIDGNVVGTAWGSSGLKSYVDSKVGSVDLSTRVAKTGDTMTGQLIVSGANIQLLRGSHVRYIHNDGNNSVGFLNSGGGWGFRSDNAGNAFATAAVYAGGAYLNTDGNVVGSVWGNWGASDAYSAISARIENRAQAWAGTVNVMGTLAAQGHHGVGTYTLCYNQLGNGGYVAIGAQVAGGSLRGGTDQYGRGQQLPGNWRAMSDAFQITRVAFGSNESVVCNLYLRYA